MFISHCHVFPEGVFNKNEPHFGTIPRLKEIMKELGIAKAIVLAPFEYQVKDRPNEWLAEAIASEPNIFGFAAINPKDDDAVEKVERFAQSGLVGLKVHPPVFQIQINDPSFDDFYATAEELNMPIQFHTGIHGWYLQKYMPILLDDVAQKHPNLKIILSHIGGTAFFGQALAVIQNNRNCYAGLAQTRRETLPWHISMDRIQILLNTVGAERIIYGTDYPYNELDVIKEDIEWINSWKIKAKDKDKILGGNIQRLISDAK